MSSLVSGKKLTDYQWNKVTSAFFKLDQFLLKLGVVKDDTLVKAWNLLDERRPDFPPEKWPPPFNKSK